MAYVQPQVQVFQEFSTVPNAVTNPLRAHISGPHAQLIRFAEADEQSQGRLGYYDPATANDYVWPNRPAGGIVDQGYTKLWVKNALLQYFTDAISGGSTITKVAGYNNRIRSASVNFRENGDDYPRSALLYDRDVKNGDIVKVRGVDEDNTSITLWTYVKDVIADSVDTEIDPAESDANNQATQTESSSVTQIAGAANCVTLTADPSGYDGLAAGYVTETYDILVTAGSTGGDYTTATLRIISGSGEDDVTTVTPAIAGSPTAIGTRGLYVTFNEADTAACSASATSASVSADDLITGQRFRVTVNQSFTAPTPTSLGTYTGQSTTYILTVSRGGFYGADEPPQIMVSTTNGVDVGGPVDIDQVDTAFAVGSDGLEISFSGAGLRKGDKYYVTTTGVTDGPMRTIVLGHNLSTDINAGSQVELTLFIKKDSLQISENRTGFAPLVNFEQSDTEITVNDGIVAYDESWTDDGEQLPLDVISESTKRYGELFVETRYWLNTKANAVYDISDVGDIDDISGALDPDNPLKWGVFKALENANGTSVKYTAVADPDDADSWQKVLRLLQGREDVYGLVPLTRNRTVCDLYAAHCLANSSAEKGLWRVLWVNLTGVPEIPLVSAGTSVPNHTAATTEDGEVALCVIEDDPDTSGSQYTIVRCTSNNANFLTNGVEAGDVLRTLFTTDGFGSATYQEFLVDEVVSEDELRLLTGPDAPISVASKFEVWRTLDSTQEAAEIALQAGSWGSRRVRATWPDQIESSGTIQEGYFLNCALAGLSSGVLPHQGLTNLEITGFSSADRSARKFNNDDLDTMAASGVWVVTQDLVGGNAGQIYTRDALTTGDQDDLNQSKEMITRNVDSISFRLKAWFRPYIGVTNVVPRVLARMREDLDQIIQVLQNEADTTNLGGQLITATIVRLERHATQKNKTVIELRAEVPFAQDYISISVAI